MKQKARLEIQQNSEDGTIRLQLWQDNDLVRTLDGIEDVYPAMEEMMGGLREDYISFKKNQKVIRIK